jgi:hypothetical protein
MWSKSRKKGMALRGSSRSVLLPRALSLTLVAVTAGMGTVHAQGNTMPEAETRTSTPVASSETVEAPAIEDGSARRRNAAATTRRSRAHRYHDFLRIAWVPPGLQVTTLGKPKAKRVFVTASSFFDPPATVDELVNYVGNFYHDRQDLAVMVCRPPLNDPKVDPALATWPNLMPMIKGDLGDCSASSLGPGEREICEVAERYQDRKSGIYAYGLKKVMDLAALLFKTTSSQNALWDNFGIATAFSGLGFTVWGSSTPTRTVHLTTANVLRHSVVPEYVLKNATLTDAHCHCVQVAESEALHSIPVDPAVVWEIGELTEQGACRQLPRPEALAAVD